jgi:hypothetical protein
MGQLTQQQKEAIAWVDLAAGLASAETGPVSFLIAAAASMAYYKDKVANEGWMAVITEEPTLPSNSNNQGVLHNLVCEKYLTDGYDQVTYNEVLITAVKVRPDLTDTINAISEDYFHQKVEMTQQLNLSSTDDKMNVIGNTVPVHGADRDLLFQSLVEMENSNSDDEFQNKVQNTIEAIPNFELNDSDKIILTNSFEILRNSYQLWSK